jgi:hypothetical protein
MRAGGSFRGVNTGVVQNTPGGGGFGSASSGAGAGGTSGGAGGAGSGASGLVQSTLGTGTNVSIQRLRQTSTTSITRNRSQTPLFMARRRFSRTRRRATSDMQSFPTGTTLSAVFDNNRGATNSPNSFLNPTLNSYYHVALQQQLLAGFGGPARPVPP